MEDKIKESIKQKVLNNRLPCPVARKIAQELSVSFQEVGRAADELKIKITDCELGCF
jgi:DNA-binding transcriptional MocR family regulator